MKRINNIFKIELLIVIWLGIIYPCTNCSIPIANAGDDFDVINGGIGEFDIILETPNTTLRLEHKLATEDTNGGFQFNGIKKEIDYDYVYCFGVSPNDLWFIIQTRKWCEMNLTTNMAKNVEGGYKYTVRKNLMIPLTEENFKSEIEKIV